MLFDGYPKSENDEWFERLSVIASLLAGLATLWILGSNHVDWYLSFRAGVGTGLILFTPIFAFALSESIRFAAFTLCSLIALSWFGVGFDVLDQLADPSPHGQFWLNLIGRPWWDSTAFKVGIEATAVSAAAYCAWPARREISAVVLFPFHAASRLLTRSC